MKRATLQIVRELTTLGDSVMWIVGPGEMVSENYSRGIREPQEHGKYLTVGAHNWLFHMEPEMVGGIQFVETHGDLTSHYVRFTDRDGETLLRAYVPRADSSDGDSPGPVENSRFEALREQHANTEGVERVRREVRFSGAS